MTFGKRKGVSPVIATVILVAVAITVAVGVSYWMGGISAQYTQFEKVEIQTGYSTFVAGAAGGWQIDLQIKNSGSAASTITHVFVNDVPVTLTDPAGSNFPNTAPGSVACDIITAGRTLEAGESDALTIWIDDDYGLLSAGTTVNIKLHSAGGMDYIKLIRLV
jgi:flagellin-like protein